MSYILDKILRKISVKDSKALVDTQDESAFEQILLKTHSFRMLLSSCAQLWQNLQQMEQALVANKYFNMIYVRSMSTKALLRVFSIIKCRQEIGNTDTQVLTFFNQLRAEIGMIVDSEFPVKSDELTLHLSRVDPRRIDQVGSRMALLAKMGAVLSDVRMPSGFVITDAGYQLFIKHNNLQDEINRLLQSMEITSIADLHRLSSQLQMIIINAQIPPALEKAIMQGYKQLEMETGYRGIKLVLRPSTGIPERNFPLESLIRDEFNVGEEFLLRAYKEVVARKYSVSAINYRMRRGLKEEDLPVCVGCLDMINTNVSGSINFIESRESGYDQIIIRAVTGMDAAISQGIVQPDMWKVGLDKPQILHVAISEKKIRHAFFLSEEGLNLIPVPRNQSRAPCLNNKQILELTGIAILIKKKLGAVGKVRWALDTHDGFAILEAIPLKETGTANFFDHPKHFHEYAQGLAVSRGKASGKVFIAHKNADILRFPENSVLVVHEANSKWASIVPWSNAVITEKFGDPFGHLASMARDFQIPAMYGVDMAASAFTTGQMITVDSEAAKARPCSMENEAGYAYRNEVHPLMGTPVYQALENVLRITGSLSKAYPLNGKNFKKPNLQDIAHLSHLSATSSLLDIAMANTDRKNPLYGQPGVWHVWNLERPGPPEMIKDNMVGSISSTPLRAFIEGTSMGGKLRFISRKESSMTRRFFYTAFNTHTFYNPIFSRPAHIMYTESFTHICFGYSNLGILIQALLNDYNPENFIFLLIKKHKSGPLQTDLGLEKILCQNGFLTRLEKNYFLARKSGDNNKLIRSMLLFAGIFLARLSGINSKEQKLLDMGNLAQEIMLKIPKILSDED